MNRDRLFLILGIGILIILGGTLMGAIVGRTIPAQVQVDQEVATDPVERFELGRDSFTPPKVVRRQGVTSAPNENREYGARRNGKRLLVPNESAKKKERMRLTQEQREHDAWRMESFGEPSQFSEKPTTNEDVYPSLRPGYKPPPKPVAIDAVDDSPPVTVNGNAKKPADATGQPAGVTEQTELSSD